MVMKYAICNEGFHCKLDDLHIHFLYIKCGQTHCLKEIHIPTMDLPDGFSFKSAKFVIKGTCPKCK